MGLGSSFRPSLLSCSRRLNNKQLYSEGAGDGGGGDDRLEDELQSRMDNLLTIDESDYIRIEAVRLEVRMDKKRSGERRQRAFSIQ